MLLREALPKKKMLFEIVQKVKKTQILKCSIRLQDENEFKKCGLQGLLKIKNDLMKESHDGNGNGSFAKQKV